jgi:hypothetical protein
MNNIFENSDVTSKGFVVLCCFHINLPSLGQSLQDAEPAAKQVPGKPAFIFLGPFCSYCGE